MGEMENINLKDKDKEKMIPYLEELHGSLFDCLRGFQEKLNKSDLSSDDKWNVALTCLCKVFIVVAQASGLNKKVLMDFMERNISLYSEGME